MEATKSVGLHGAKVGDWVITDRGECYELQSVDDPYRGFGQAFAGRYLAWSLDDGTSGRYGTARLATPKELAAWRAKKASEKAERDARDKAEEDAERVRAAAPDLLAALRQIAHDPPIEDSPTIESILNRAQRIAREAIAKATTK